MSDLRQAAQQALEALTLLQGDIEWTSNSPTLKFVNSTVAALRAALAEPEQEPVVWMYDFLNPNNREEVIRNWVTQSLDDIEREKGFNVRPLYTAPTPRKPLTDEEIEVVWHDTRPYYDHQDFARAIERAHGIGEQQ